MPPLEQRHLDRIRGLYMGRPDSERFTALMLAQIAGPEVTEQTLNAVRGQAPDLNRRISEAGNRPLRHFLNKTEKQIRNELGGDDAAVNVVMSGLTDLGAQIPERQTGMTAADETESRARRPGRMPQTPEVAPSAPIGANGRIMPVFGRDQYPADEIWDLSEAELLAMEGVTEGDVTRLRNLREENRRALAAQRAVFTTATPGNVTLAATGNPPVAQPGEPETSNNLATGLAEPGQPEGAAPAEVAPEVKQPRRTVRQQAAAKPEPAGNPAESAEAPAAGEQPAESADGAAPGESPELPR
jgi:hypothetical protein